MYIILAQLEYFSNSEIALRGYLKTKVLGRL